MMMKKIAASFLTLMLIATGILFFPKYADAGTNDYITEEGILYTNDYKMTEYKRVADASATSPTKNGYVFGGWYKKGEGNTFTAYCSSEPSSDTAYAKFVPAYVLSVKAQNDINTKSANDGKKANVRVVSSVDCTDYSKVGFDIWVNNCNQVFADGVSEPLETTKIYTGLRVGPSPSIRIAEKLTLTKSGTTWVEEENTTSNNDGVTDTNNNKVKLSFNKVDPNGIAGIYLKTEAITEGPNATKTLSDVYGTWTYYFRGPVEFELLTGEKKEVTVTGFTTVTDGIYVNLSQQEGQEKVSINDVKSVTLQAGTILASKRTPQEVFGEASKYLSTWRLDNIADKYDSSIIYVRPYWITKDGTRVDGLGKYIHIEDGYLGYISVPVNLLKGETVAGGIVHLTYNTDELEFIDFEAGRLLPKMKYNTSERGVIRILGNATENVTVDGLYANVRFRLRSGLSELTAKEFTMTVDSFCNWEEELVKDVQVWNYRY